MAVIGLLKFNGPEYITFLLRLSVDKSYLDIQLVLSSILNTTRYLPITQCPKYLPNTVIDLFTAPLSLVIANIVLSPLEVTLTFLAEYRKLGCALSGAISVCIPTNE